MTNKQQQQQHKQKPTKKKMIQNEPIVVQVVGEHQQHERTTTTTTTTMDRRGTDGSNNSGTEATQTSGESSECFNSVEFGMTGDHQADESYFDERLLFAVNDDDDDDETNSNNGNDRRYNHNLEDNKHNDDGFCGGTATGRVQFSKKKLYGRDTELIRINEILQRLSVVNDDDRDPLLEEVRDIINEKDSSVNDVDDDNFQSQVLLLSGYSGCGKTRLVQEAVKMFTATSSPSVSTSSNRKSEIDIQARFLSAKYEEQQAPVSYKGITDAFSQLILMRETAAQGTSPFKSIRSKLEEAGLELEDLNILIEMIPSLEQALFNYPDGEEGDIDMNSKSTSYSTSIITGLTSPDSAINKSRLHNIFRCFVQILAEDKDHPIVLFIDDLQWADIETLDLLESILSDSTIHHLCFIGSYRSNEVESSPSMSSQQKDQQQPHPLSTCIQKIQSQRATETMELSELSKPDIGEFLADTLHLDLKDVAPLTDAIYSKALGNIFYTKQALEQLVRGNALYYDMMIFRWQWVLTADQLEDQLSNDIIELVKTKIEHMSPDLQSTLTVAANTTSKFDTDTLLDVLSNTEERVVDKRSLRKSLDVAVAEGLLVHSPDGTDIYAFAHDRIREAARTFCTGEELDLLLYNIGNALAKRGSDDMVGEDWMLLTAIHLLNSIPRNYHDDDGKIYLAKLNLDAAILSMSRAAFEKAFEYSKKGIEYLPSNRWEKYRSLCQELYSAAAESSRLLGDLAQMEMYCTIALTAQRDRPMEEKFQILFTMAMGIFYLGDRSDQAKFILLSLLDHLGCRFPKSRTMTSSRTICKLVALIVTKKRRTTSELDATGFMTDTKKIEAMKLLDKLFDICYLTRDEVLLPLVIFQALDYTLRYGLSIYSPRLVASVCIIFMGVVNDVEGSGLYAKYALELLKRVEHRHRPIVTGTVFFAYTFGMNWILPIQDCIQPLQDAYRIGTINGDVENTLWSKYHSILYTFQAGRSLASINSDCRIHVPIMQERGRRIIIIFTMTLWRTTLRLMGRDHADVEKAAPLNLIESESQTPTAVYVLLTLMIGSIERIEKGYNGEYGLCADSALKGCESFRKHAPGNPISTIDVFVSAVSSFEMARRTQKSAYRKEAMRLKKCICSWAKQGNPNTRHWRSLLEAEYAFLKGKNTAADRHYMSAVDLATKGGYTHDAALAYERWGMFILSQKHDSRMAISKLQESQRRFKEWGAARRVEQLAKAIQEIGVDKQMCNETTDGTNIRSISSIPYTTSDE